MQKSIIRAVLICLSIKNMHAMTDPITDPISVRTVDDKIVIVSKPDIQHFATLKNALVDSSELRDSPIPVSRVTKEVLEQLVNDVRSEDVQDEALVPMQKAIALLSGADYLQAKMGLVEKYAKIVAKGLLSDEWMQKFHESSAEHPCLNPHGLTDRLKNLLYRYMPDRWINGNTIFLEGGDHRKRFGY